MNKRGGTALIVVLVVIVLMSLAAYSFSEIMIAESEASLMFGRDAQARAFAASGVELAAAMLGSPDETVVENLYHNPQSFAGVLMLDSPSHRGRGRFTVVAPVENDENYKQFRYGLMDESGKLNLNSLLGLGLDDEQLGTLLMAVPGMTEDAADGILDWLDSDDEPRPYGAETDTYEALAHPYAAKNGKLETLDEVLLVNGVDAALLYGEDANRNGLLDPNEDDGDAQLPSDNEDGVLDLGWSGYLTVYGRESNVRTDGSERIDVNQTLLTELYDELAEEFDEEVAKFIVAYRMNRATNVEPIDGQSSGQQSTGDQGTDKQLQAVAAGIAKNILGGSNQGGVTRGGMDLSKGASAKIGSLYELIDAEVEVQTVDGNETTTETLTSPWSSDPSDLQQNWPTVLDTLTTASTTFIEGRININQARKELLTGLPDMTADLADGIAASRPIGADGAPQTEKMESRATTAWLLIEGLTDLTTMRKLDKYITARGDVFRVQVVGHFDLGGPAARLEAVIDATASPPMVVFQRDLSVLGAGYRLQGLFQQTGL